MPRISDNTPVQYRARALGPWSTGFYAGKAKRGHLVRTSTTNALIKAVSVRVVPQVKAPPIAEVFTPKPSPPPARTVRVDGRPVALPKPTPPLSCEAYLAWVRKMPCCFCSAPPPSDPHHYGPRGVGQKTDDLRVAPLCRPCHDVLHSQPLTPRIREVLLAAQVDLLVRWIGGER